MVKISYYLWFFIALSSFFMACSEGNKTNEGELEPPRLVASVPANGAADIPVPGGEITIVLTYDQNLYCPSEGHSRISLGDAVVTSVSVSTSNLTIKASGLNKNTEYQLVVPEGVVQGPTHIGAAQVTLGFTTEQEAEITATLCTPGALPQAQNVYNYLLANYGSKIISGAMARVNWNTEEAERVYRWTGKYPALNCFDYIHIYASPAGWIDYTDTSVAENWWNNNGLLGASWHWNVPVSTGSSEVGFYYTGKNNGSGETSFDITKALQEGTAENACIKADLDEIADNLLLLQAKNIPVIWRPLHEAAGGWFWWGAKGAEPYKALWKLMFDTFKAKGVKNLIWVWTTVLNDDDWYPGNAYVDIIGCDIYNKPDASGMVTDYRSIEAKYPDKMITLSECGNIAGIAVQWNAGARWSWFMPWYDYDATDVSDNIFATKEFWQNAFALDYVITRDQLPDFK